MLLGIEEMEPGEMEPLFVPCQLLSILRWLFSHPTSSVNQEEQQLLQWTETALEDLRCVQQSTQDPAKRTSQNAAGKLPHIRKQYRRKLSKKEDHAMLYKISFCFILKVFKNSFSHIEQQNALSIIFRLN